MVTVVSTATDSGSCSSQRTERNTGCSLIFASTRGRRRCSVANTSTSHASSAIERTGWMRRYSTMARPSERRRASPVSVLPSVLSALDAPNSAGLSVLNSESMDAVSVFFSNACSDEMVACSLLLCACRSKMPLRILDAALRVSWIWFSTSCTRVRMTCGDALISSAACAPSQAFCMAFRRLKSSCSASATCVSCLSTAVTSACSCAQVGSMSRMRR